MSEMYAKVIQNLITKGVSESDVMKNLMAHLERKGRVKLLPSILRDLKVVQARAVVTGATVEVATEADAKHALASAQAEGITAEKAQVNPLLLSGWRAREGGKLVDRSGKRALVDLYARIVKH